MMVKGIHEITTAYGSTIESLTKQRARQLKKIQDAEQDIKKGMNTSLLMLDWGRDVKYFLESNTDAKVVDGSIIETYEKYVEELIGWINENQRSPTSNDETNKLIEELGKQVRKLNKEVQDKNTEIKLLKTGGRSQTIPKPQQAPVEEEVVSDEVPVEEEGDGILGDVEEELPSQEEDVINPEIEQSEELPEQQPSDEELAAVTPVIDKPARVINKDSVDIPKNVYITDSQLAHLRRVDTKEFEYAKIEATRIRRAYDMFADYSTVEHRYYNTVCPVFGVNINPLDLSKENLCRVCKTSISNKRSVCNNALCKNIMRKFKQWYVRYSVEFEGIDHDLKVVAVRQAKADRLNAARKAQTKNRPPLAKYEEESRRQKS